MDNTNNDNNNPSRRRGRPAGKDRVPLTAEEKRARNAEYERQRRVEHAEAMSQLAKEAGLSKDLSSEAILKAVTEFFKKMKRKESLSWLRNKNLQLELEVRKCEYRLQSSAPPNSPSSSTSSTVAPYENASSSELAEPSDNEDPE